jgi:GntR family transcriptional regulator
MTSGSPSTSLVPLYRQVSDRLIADITAGRIAPHQALPAEHALCAQFGVSRITVRKALDELAARGIVVRRQGVGTFVGAADSGTWSVSLTGVIEDVLMPTQPRILRQAERAPPAEVLQFAGLPAKTRLHLMECVNCVTADEPMLHAAYYFPASVAAQLTPEALSGPARVINVVQQKAGCVLDHADQVVLPMIAPARIARLLRIAPGTAVLRAIRAYYDTTGRLIELLDAAYHPTNYRYTARLYPRLRDGTLNRGR